MLFCFTLVLNTNLIHYLSQLFLSENSMHPEEEKLDKTVHNVSKS